MPPPKKIESDPISRNSESRDFLYQQIATKIRTEIHSETYPAGSRLPSMDALAAQFEVNKITVLKAMDELKNEGIIYSLPAKGTYVTKINRDNVAQRKNSTIGMFSHLIQRELGPYHMGIVTGIQDELSRRKSSLLLLPTDGLHTDAELCQLVLNAEVDAMIYLGRFQNALIDRLIQNGPPSVLIDYSYTGCQTDSIVFDSTGGGYQIMTHLLQLGHQKIALVTGDFDDVELMVGVAQALSNAQMTLDDLVIIDGNYTCLSGYDATCKILKEHAECTAICCMNDEMAAGALQAIYAESSMKVPEDISVTGFDDVQLSEITTPPITSIHTDIQHMGRIAIRRLMDRMADLESNPTVTRISTHLVERDSCGTPRHKS